MRGASLGLRASPELTPGKYITAALTRDTGGDDPLLAGRHAFSPADTEQTQPKRGGRLGQISNLKTKQISNLNRDKFQI
jgi:hypothetical protein